MSHREVSVAGRGVLGFEVQGLLLAAVGGVAVRLAVTGASLEFVKPSLRPLLVVAGGMLVALGGLTLVMGARRREAASTNASSHEHSTSRASWLLLLPLLVMVAVGPGALGSFAASRQPARLVAPDGAFPPLQHPAHGPLPMRIGDFATRAAFDTSGSLRGISVELTGFVRRDPSGAGRSFLLTRFVMNCCAADARPVSVLVEGLDAPVPPADSWLQVVGVWQPSPHAAASPSDPPLLKLQSLMPMATPSYPYES